jgi:hypothetical protein
MRTHAQVRVRASSLTLSQFIATGATMIIFYSTDSNDQHTQEVFKRWRDQYPDGYCINCRTQTDFMLHHASCVHMVFRENADVNLAENKKVCSLRREELEQWAVQNSDCPLRVCSDCLKNR